MPLPPASRQVIPKSPSSVLIVFQSFPLWQSTQMLYRTLNLLHTRLKAVSSLPIEQTSTLLPIISMLSLNSHLNTSFLLIIYIVLAPKSYVFVLWTVFRMFPLLSISPCYSTAFFWLLTSSQSYCNRLLNDIGLQSILPHNPNPPNSLMQELSSVPQLCSFCYLMKKILQLHYLAYLTVVTAQANI